MTKSKIENSTLIKIFFCILFTSLISCGPRSGIHNDEETEKEKNQPGLCGNAFSEDNSKGAKLFKQNCAVCHRSHCDQKLTGPGLKGIFDRIPKPAEEWFIKYTLNNERVFKSGDAYAKKLKHEYKDHLMTIFEDDLTEADVKEIIAYLKNPSYTAF